MWFEAQKWSQKSIELCRIEIRRYQGGKQILYTHTIYYYMYCIIMYNLYLFIYFATISMGKHDICDAVDCVCMLVSCRFININHDILYALRNRLLTKVANFFPTTHKKK